MNDVGYSLERDLAVEEFIDVPRRSTLAERRPVDDSATMAGMLAHADVIVTARTAQRLVIGVSRAISGLHTHLVLLAAPKARTYYPHIGMRPHDSCWAIDPMVTL